MKNSHYFLVFISLLIFGCGKNKIDTRSLSAAKYTLQNGYALQGFINDYYLYHGYFPTYSEFTILAYDIGAVSEQTTDKGVRTINPIFTNEGGWVYNEKTGEIHINNNRRLFLDTFKENWIIPSNIKFYTNINLSVSHVSTNILHQKIVGVLNETKSWYGIIPFEQVIKKHNLKKSNAPQIAQDDEKDNDSVQIARDNFPITKNEEDKSRNAESGKGGRKNPKSSSQNPE